VLVGGVRWGFFPCRARVCAGVGGVFSVRCVLCACDLLIVLRQRPKRTPIRRPGPPTRYRGGGAGILRKEGYGRGRNPVYVYRRGGGRHTSLGRRDAGGGEVRVRG